MIRLIRDGGRLVTPLGPLVHASPLSMATRVRGRPCVMHCMKPVLTKLYLLAIRTPCGLNMLSYVTSPITLVHCCTLMVVVPGLGCGCHSVWTYWQRA